MLWLRRQETTGLESLNDKSVYNLGHGFDIKAATSTMNEMMIVVDFWHSRHYIEEAEEGGTLEHFFQGTC